MVMSLSMRPLPKVSELVKSASEGSHRAITPPMLWATMSACTAATPSKDLKSLISDRICASTFGALYLKPRALARILLKFSLP